MSLGGNFSTSFSDIGAHGEQVFGAGTSSRGSGSETVSGTSTTKEKLNIDQDAIDKIIADVLGGAEGLAAIFSGEQVAGIFDSTVAAQAAGDLASKLVGEIAKLTAERESTTVGTSTSRTKQTASSGSGGALEQVFGIK